MTDTTTEATQTTEATVTEDKAENDKSTLAIAMPPEFLELIKKEATEKKLSASRFALELLATQLEYNLPTGMRVRRVGVSDDEKKQAAKQKRDQVSALMKLVQKSGMSIEDLAAKLASL